MFRFWVILLLAAVVLAACSSSPAASPAPTTAVVDQGAAVSLKNISFNPSTVTIHPGQTVVWTWHDGSVPHNVTFPGFHSVIQTSGTYVHTFNTAGTFSYSCTIHSGMTGTVVVAS
jgi:plastocyanin